ncbi:MAG: hypothetical protein M3Q14_02875 [bacterium]|nr:hypothetical protein [bacterium]
MIQFNLLPDVKVEFIKTLKLKRTVMAVSIIAVATAIGLLLLMFSLTAVQKRHVSNLDGDISRLKSELESTEDLTRILSVQNQLNALPTLYNGQPAVDRLPGYIDQTTPSGIGITEMSVDYSLSTVEIIGDADNLKTLNGFVDTLRYTTFKDTTDSSLEIEGQAAPSAFGAINLVQFGRDSEKATFTLTFSFDPVIFDVTRNISLTVPSIVTTRADVPSPDLFNGTVPVDGTAGTQ